MDRRVLDRQLLTGELTDRIRTGPRGILAEIDPVSQPPPVLIFGGNAAQSESAAAALAPEFPALRIETLEQALDAVHKGLSGILLLDSDPDRLSDAVILPHAGGLLSRIPEGIALLDLELRVLWCNEPFVRLARTEGQCVGRSFYDIFGTPEILGPDLSPFHTAMASGMIARSQLRLGEKLFYNLEATPVIRDLEPVPQYLVVTVRDVSTEVLQQQKLEAIYRAGLELGELAPSELLHMSVQDRVELLKSKIIHYTQELLEYNTVEIRLLDRVTGKLEPLLAVGMEEEATKRDLFAKAHGNGVTGFVAATGKSYLCEDTAHDPLYLVGAADARSSLTVPLILHDETLGTFNVESPKPGAFTENDLHFLELFGREVAVALNTLELLVAEKMTTASESTERLLREVASPVDEVLNEATWVLDRYIGHDPAVAQRLQRILKHTRNIKQLIHKVGEAILPKVAHPPLPQRPQRPKLRDKRILVADADETVRSAAHELLGKHGCEVETAHNGEEALMMVRSFQYDLVLVDIRLPDMTGFECFCGMREGRPDLPVILMTGFGYDPGHSIVKARERGCKSVLYKPFRVHQLLDEVEKAVESTDSVANAGP